MVRETPPEFVWQLYRYDATVYCKCWGCNRRTPVDWWKFRKVMGERIAAIEPKMRCIYCGQKGNARLSAPPVAW